MYAAVNAITQQLEKPRCIDLMTLEISGDVKGNVVRMINQEKSFELTMKSLEEKVGWMQDIQNILDKLRTASAQAATFGEMAPVWV